ncbi:MAG: hypothetical protein AAGD00_03890 [Planctomycetota bacterium]
MSEPAPTPLRPIFGFSRLGYALLAIAIVLAGVFAWVRVYDIDVSMLYLRPIAERAGFDVLDDVLGSVILPLSSAPPALFIDGRDGVLGGGIGFSMNHVIVILIAWHISARPWKPRLAALLAVWGLVSPLGLWAVNEEGYFAVREAFGSGSIQLLAFQFAMPFLVLLLLCLVVREVTQSRFVRQQAYFYAVVGFALTASFSWQIWQWSASRGGPWTDQFTDFFGIISRWTWIAQWWMPAFAITALACGIADRWRSRRHALA